MRPPTNSTTFKREFLKKWLLALQLCNNHHNNNNKNGVVERKNTIKLSAEIAMAAARNGATCWSRALIAKHSSSSSLHNQTPPPRHSKKRVLRCKRIIRRSRRCIHHGPAAAVVRRKTAVLRKLVPGGELMGDEASLIRETLDYVTSLRAQIDVMRRLARASDRVAMCNGMK
ncbi:unnamed protein product [Linum tenue]|uniref:IBH1-like N-terminal domain-containing protein n=1 Tax=Linum tenue TaxID=586396 RepID=A0AAV0L1F2_9ROSI|nr:unnamed protein product [Linum tenue]